MPVFAYRALTAGGRSASGVVDADGPRGAWQSLRAQGLYPTELAEAADGGRAGAVPVAELAAVTRQLALLVRANVPVADALDAAAEVTTHERLSASLTHVRAAVREGRSLADALATAPDVFPAAYREQVRAGEAGGALAPVLARIAAHAERMAALRARLRAALAYPLVTAVATCAVLVFLVGWVLPEMATLFRETGAPVPLVARVLLGVAGALQASWWLWAPAGVAVAVGLYRWGTSAAGRVHLDRWLLAAPRVGRIVAAAALARVTRTLATLLAGGVRLDTALGMAATAAGNQHVAAAVLAAAEQVRQGQPLATALRASERVPPLVLRLVATGERTGALADALEHAADALDADVERDVATATALVEPALVILMGVAVLVLVTSVLVPILTLDPFAVTR